MKPLYFSASISFIVLILLLGVFNLEFTGYRSSDFLAPFWYFISGTAKITSIAVILMLTFVYLKYNYKKFSSGQKGLYLFFGLIIFFQISVAAITTFVLKNFFERQRPAQQYLAENGIIKDREEFLEMSPDKREIYLKEMNDSVKEPLKEIYPPVVSEWAAESGYSFPSGHASSSFYIAVILSFIILRTNKSVILSQIPFIWAVLVCLSRVTLGLHYKTDVIAGALLGLIAAFMLLSFKKINTMFPG